MSLHPDEIAVDLFAGGGGTSTGMADALGRPVDVALNHDAVAMAVHEANHPATRHVPADIWRAKPSDVTHGRPVGLLWASPDCRHHSRAKGSAPRSKSVRSLAWAVVRWAREVAPRVVMVENVMEFEEWGPLDRNGERVREKKGDTFRAWAAALRRLGYAVEWRRLDASHFGAPTKRIRLFVIARRDGVPIRWPLPTHGRGLLPLRTAAECIDWSLPCPSIFTRKKPLAEKTLWRIAQGIRRFVLESGEPFIVSVNHGRHEDRARSIGDLFPTVTAARRSHALVTAFLAKHFGGQVGHAPTRPIGAVTARDHHALAAATLVKMRGECHGADVAEPLPTISAGGGKGGVHVAEVRAFLTAYFGTGVGQSLRTPARTLTTKHRLGLVTVEGTDYQIVDIGMRMLEPHELLRAQFGEYAEGYNLSAARTKAAKVRLIGNSVCPHVAAALVAANFRLAVPQGVAS